MKTHWLFGFGPEHKLEFKVEIDVETQCSTCLHKEVCSYDMERRCSNFLFSTSEGRGCQGCLHRFTRYDKDRVPCFHCEWHLGGGKKTPKRKELSISQLVPGKIYLDEGAKVVFSRIGAIGSAIFHPPGEPDTQSSFAASETYVRDHITESPKPKRRRK